MNGEELFMERNLARDVALFNPPKNLVQGKVEEYRRISEEEYERKAEDENYTRIYDPLSGKSVPAVKEWIPVVGYKDAGRAVYLPVQLAELLKDLPFARTVLAGLSTLWLEDREKNRKGLYRRRPDGGLCLYMAEVNTTLGEICRTIGLAPNGPNRMRVKRALETLNQTRFKNVVFFELEVEEKAGRKKVKKIEARQETLTTLITHLEFQEAVMDGKRRETTVTVFICPPLTAALALDTPKARIPLTALKATYGHTKATREMQNLLFYLAAVSPEKKKGQPLQFREETLLEVMKPMGLRRDKNVRRLEKTLNALKKTGVIEWWKKEGGHYLIQKKNWKKKKEHTGSSAIS